ncbi:MAG TPA: PaaI family thioesterase [Candidatus Limnocylindria bacterium]|nr:PaaI family thioesterase [Candidatus Limnocylindria bacterium]
MSSPDELTRRYEEGGYVRALGVRVAAVSEEVVRLELPFAEGNSNPGGALHGGVAASLVLIGAAAAAEASGAETPERSTVDVSVAYLAAAIEEAVTAEARVLRRGKELTFVEVDVRTGAGKPIARGLAARRLAGDTPADRLLVARDAARVPDDAARPGFTKIFTAAPFMRRLGLEVVHVAQGTAVVRLPWTPANADHDGTLHEGALAALADTAGAMASWSLVPLDPRNKASTPAVHATFHGPVRGEAVIARARTVARRDEIFTNAVTVVGESSGVVVASATVTYRIVVPRG